MSMILFTHSYFYRFDKKQWANKQYYPPLGTITAAAYLRENGHNVSLFDTNLVLKPEEIIPQLKELKPSYLVIYDDGFNYLTKMCLTLMREAAFELIKTGKEFDCKVIVSSSDSTDHYQEYIEKGADFILLGEGEESLLAVVDELEASGKEFQKIKGLAFKNTNGIVNTGRREVMDDLDKIPMAAWDLVDIEKYKNIWMEHHGYFSLNIATTRGCPYSCNWCAKPIFGRKYNSRSPEKVVKEIEFLISNFEVSHFWVCDDIFGLKPGWVAGFRDLVVQKKLKFSYMMQSRVDVMLKENNIKALAESGLDIVWVGAESGSQKVLDAMEKDIKVAQIYEARKKLKNEGVRIAFFLQFGYPGENYADILATEKMLFDLMPDDMGISVSYPLPGTSFYEKVKNELKQKANWTDSDDLTLMFRNTFSAKFYKILHRYLHKKFRKKQALIRLVRFIKNPMKNNKGIPRTLITLAYYIPVTIFYKLLLVVNKKEKISGNV
ncbi:MAG: B12-binding domain-containing radical SAM protein [Bacteroidales bacterium]|nr:B12-binding domain-containing radical SAM protein [Bacteroidales bacterium]MCF8405015.1 B12-binding domain-containing radical SAM protein [Bacteroidales bacterium]